MQRRNIQHYVTARGGAGSPQYRGAPKASVVRPTVVHTRTEKSSLVSTVAGIVTDKWHLLVMMAAYLLVFVVLHFVFSSMVLGGDSGTEKVSRPIKKISHTGNYCGKSKLLHAVATAARKTHRTPSAAVNSFIDVGANDGDYTALVRKLFGRSVKVTMVEPFPHNVDFLRKRFRTDRNVKVAEKAAGRDTEEARLFWTSGADSAGNARASFSGGTTRSQRYFTVQVTSLDDLLVAERMPAVDLVKITANQHEEDVLLGFEHSMAARKVKMVLFECGTMLREEYEDPEEVLKRVTYRLNDDGFNVYALATLDMEMLTPEYFEEYVTRRAKGKRKRVWQNCFAIRVGNKQLEEAIVQEYATSLNTEVCDHGEEMPEAGTRVEPLKKHGSRDRRRRESDRERDRRLRERKEADAARREEWERQHGRRAR